MEAFVGMKMEERQERILIDGWYDAKVRNKLY